MVTTQSERADALYRVAEQQLGFFTAAQARAAGYSQRLLTHHTKRRHIERWGRGVYRLQRFPQLTPAEDLVAHWLWAERAGIYTHATALQLHQLSDAMPETATMTLPSSWTKRRLRVPAGLELRFGDVSESDRQLKSGVPLTSPVRTVNDCALAFLDPDLVRQAVESGLEQRLFEPSAIGPALAYVREHCGVVLGG